MVHARMHARRASYHFAWLAARDARTVLWLVGNASDICPNIEFVPTLVNYTEIANGILLNTDGTRAYDVAYFYGGYMIILMRTDGFDEALKNFTRAGGGVIGDCGAAAIFTEGLKLMRLITIPGIGLLPFEAEIPLISLLSLAMGSSQTGMIDMANVTVMWGPDCFMGFGWASLNTFVWDGGVVFPVFSGGEVHVFARVTEYSAGRLVNTLMRHRPFFVAGRFEGDKGKVVLCPGSPEFAFALASDILGAEILYVAPRTS